MICKQKKWVGGRLARLFAGVLLAASTNAQAIDIYAVTEGGILARFDSATPGTVPQLGLVSGLGAGESVVGLDFRPSNGRLYALSKDPANAGRLYSVDRTTGAATLVATLAADPADLDVPYTLLSGTKFGMNFNPVADRLRVVSDSGMNIRVNPATGLVITDVTLNPGPPNVVGVAYINSYAGAASTTLYDIDSSSDSLLIQNPPNNGSVATVGALGVDTTAIAGFDIVTVGSDNSAYATFTVGGTVGLYSINLASGAATSLGSVGGNLELIALAVLPDYLFRNGFD
jgi:hypothetical protein